MKIKIWIMGIIIIFMGYVFDINAQTSDVQTEGHGVITKTTGEINQNGAMVWNGTEWIVNNTYAHKYYIDVRDGKRLKPVEVIKILNDASEIEIDTLSYSIFRQRYSYSHTGKNGVKYVYDAIEYRIFDPAGKEVVLRSRGTGNGINKAFFDIYLLNEDQSITALRNDPKWFTYKNMTMDQALAQTDTIEYLTGNFSSLKGWYFLDIGGGGDLGPAGYGQAFNFHTDSLTINSQTNDIASSYPVDFGLRWLESTGWHVYELQFLPKLISESFIDVPSDSIKIEDSAGGGIKFQIQTENTWTAESDQPWLTVNPASGTGDSEITITAEPNTAPNERTAHVTISISGVAVHTITVTQPGSTVGVEEEIIKPEKFELLQNYPNPFNPSTVISFQLSVFSKTQIKIYDVLGIEVATLVDEYLPAGNYEKEWNACNLPSGIYICRMTAAEYSQTIKMIIIR